MKDQQWHQWQFNSFDTLDDCELPQLSNVIAERDADNVGDESWLGSFKCESGSVLVGHQRLKCRHGLWSGAFPVCTGIVNNVTAALMLF